MDADSHAAPALRQQDPATLVHPQTLTLALLAHLIPSAALSCSERDSFETAASQAAQQAQVLEEAEGAAQQRAADLAAELQRLQVANSDARSEVAQQAGELQGLAAEVARRAAGAEAAAVAASAQAAALSKDQHELELAQAQLKAQAGGKGGKQQQDRRCATLLRLLWPGMCWPPCLCPPYARQCLYHISLSPLACPCLPAPLARPVCLPCSSDEMAGQLSSLEATYSAVSAQMERLMARTDSLATERDQLKAKVGKAGD